MRISRRILVASLVGGTGIPLAVNPSSVPENSAPPQTDPELTRASHNACSRILIEMGGASYSSPYGQNLEKEFLATLGNALCNPAIDRQEFLDGQMSPELHYSKPKSTFLTFACFLGSVPIVEALLMAGADPARKDGDRIVPLIATITNRRGGPRDQIVEMLHNTGQVDLNQPSSYIYMMYSGVPPLVIAVAYGDSVNVVRSLLARGAKPDPVLPKDFFQKISYGRSRVGTLAEYAREKNLDMGRLFERHGSIGSELRV